MVSEKLPNSLLRTESRYRYVKGVVCNLLPSIDFLRLAGRRQVHTRYCDGARSHEPSGVETVYFFLNLNGKSVTKVVQLSADLCIDRMPLWKTDNETSLVCYLLTHLLLKYRTCHKMEWKFWCRKRFAFALTKILIYKHKDFACNHHELSRFNGNKYWKIYFLRFSLFQ